MASAVLSGLLLGLSGRGDIPGLVACFALVPLMLSLCRGARPVRAGAMTLLAELGILLPAFEGAIPALPWAFPVVLLLSAPAAIFPGALYSLIGQRLSSRSPVANQLCLWSLPFSWTAAEFVAGRRWIWGDFASPVVLGYTQFGSPLIELASLAGATGVTFAVLVINVALAQAWRFRRLDPLLAVVVIGGLAFVPARVHESGQALATTVAIVQPALEADWYRLSQVLPEARSVILSRLLTLTRNVKQADLVVWPEGALPRGMTSPEVASVFGPLDVGTSHVLTGGVTTRSEGRFNSVIHVSTGAAEVVYDKLAPVPVGEASFGKGDRLAVGYWGGVWAAPLICLDSLFPTFARTLARLGAEVLVVLSDDSFSRSMATPWLHLRASAFRAVETGLPLVFASAGGPSAVIDARGEIVGRTEFGSASTLLVDLPPPLNKTLYVRLGELVGVISTSITAGLLLFVVSRGAHK